MRSIRLRSGFPLRQEPLLQQRPPGTRLHSQVKSDYLEIRLGALEKQAFKQASEIAGIPLATWARERMRRAAIKELEEVGLSIPFLHPYVQ